jgi:hypothetical protein
MTKQKKLKDCLLVFWLSILALVLISALVGYTPTEPVSKASLFYAFPQDTIKKDTVIIETAQKKLNFREQREVEEIEWKSRSEKVQTNMDKMDAQAKLLDSLLMVIDTTKTK